MKKPEQKENIDEVIIKVVCQRFIDWIDSNEYQQNKLPSWRQYIFETVMRSVFDETVMPFINDKIL